MGELKTIQSVVLSKEGQVIATEYPPHLHLRWGGYNYMVGFMFSIVDQYGNAVDQDRLIRPFYPVLRRKTKKHLVVSNIYQNIDVLLHVEEVKSVNYLLISRGGC